MTARPHKILTAYSLPFSLVFAALSLLPGLLIAQDHFNPKGFQPSSHTSSLQSALRDSLPFEDERDFEEARRGFIAEPDSRQIIGAAGNIVWDMTRYDFLLTGENYDSIHPSLQRQATLNMNFGLFEVVPDFLYQVRGFDLANMTLVKSDTGWIIFDTLLTDETAAAAFELATEQLGEFPIKAVVYSHSHIDHFGGVHGIIDEAEVAAGEVQVIAPSGFMEEAISENVYAGNAMSRRAALQYGRLIPSSPFGQVDSAIGKGLAAGTTGLIAPSLVIEDDYETHVIDGVTMVFQNTPGTEAPAEMNTWFPEQKVFWAAENITATIHNIYTLRGALVRDALAWSRGINEALYRYGREAEVLVSSHNWPRWGNDRIQQVMRAQRDAYANLNNQVLNLLSALDMARLLNRTLIVPPFQWPRRRGTAQVSVGRLVDPADILPADLRDLDHHLAHRRGADALQRLEEIVALDLQLLEHVAIDEKHYC